MMIIQLHGFVNRRDSLDHHHLPECFHIFLAHTLLCAFVIGFIGGFSRRLLGGGGTGVGGGSTTSGAGGSTGFGRFRLRVVSSHTKSGGRI